VLKRHSPHAPERILWASGMLGLAELARTMSKMATTASQCTQTLCVLVQGLCRPPRRASGLACCAKGVASPTDCMPCVLVHARAVPAAASGEGPRLLCRGRRQPY